MSDKQLYIYYVGPVNCDYDEYDAFVVAAYTPAEARSYTAVKSQPAFKNAEVENLGRANNRQKPGVVLGSFNAG